jgi:hypothetical protein
LKLKHCFLVLMVTIFIWSATSFPVSGHPAPTFVIFTSGFWGSMDKLPSCTPSWMAASPYPHFHKHQAAAFLTGPEYQPIPQSMMAVSEGPSITSLLMCTYYRMEHEFAYWARNLNRRAGWERVKIYDDWQDIADQPDIGEINIIYLKYDWRLDLPQVERDYAGPLLAFLYQRWPEAKIHWFGHSLGGLVGRYEVSCHPGRITSLISIGGPHYGIYEVGMQRRGEKVTYGGNLDQQLVQECSLSIAARILLDLKTVKPGRQFPAAVAQLSDRYLPMMRWMDPETGLLADGFNSLAKLKEAVPHAIAFYGLGFGAYDLSGNYHPEVPDSYGVGPRLEPGTDSPPEYALTGDGRVDPVSARGPFTQTLCLGKETLHGNMMWSPLVLLPLIDRYFFNGEMSPADQWLALRRMQVSYLDGKKDMLWLQKARKAWEAGN